MKKLNLPHHIHKYDFYDKNGIRMYFKFDDPSPNGQLDIYLFANNYTAKSLYHFKCLISTPTSITSSLHRPTTTTLLANNANTLSQLIKINNPQKINIKLRLKISYEIDGIKREEIFSVFDFPEFNYS
uniref:AP-1 complex subunit gamma-1 (Trinotate prediction) n=1 Tax=Myxobolus squamalis TaxID=59785 RepID=A0A6B2G7Z6_MYXSQ